jgi:NAD(P)H-quinone oxidoreductase subunit 5
VGASLIAIAQIDIKRTLSYIVSSYMGLVFIAVGTGQTQTALTLIFAYSLAMGLLVMSIGSVVWNSITQDVRSLGGLWPKRPISGISFLVGAAGLVGLPPFGCFWALSELAGGLSETHPSLLVVVLFVNGVTAFGLVRVFGLVFGGKPKQMTERSPEVHWPFILPMTVLMGFTLHVPHLLAAWQLLPLATLNYTAAGLLVLSSAIGIGAGAFIYLNEKWEKPVRIGSQALQDFFAYDFYTAQLYRVTVIFAVGLVAQIVSWVDRNIIDGFVNLIGFATVLGGQSLKYNVNGQTQFYALTILFGVALLGLLVSWPLLARLSLIVGG